MRIPANSFISSAAAYPTALATRHLMSGEPHKNRHGLGGTHLGGRAPLGALGGNQTYRAPSVPGGLGGHGRCKALGLYRGQGQLESSGYGPSARAVNHLYAHQRDLPLSHSSFICGLTIEDKRRSKPSLSAASRAPMEGSLSHQSL